ncbi:protein O-mannosyl-transferase family [candidate division CSSED10-310 bacterium]|uniref:Protein O-mannosyl-transferase family n=1 Tax=candidate division CSSED10-310 bacterium TaxID=2855610 RepID=A0ABV6YU84_UNCC1
MFNKSSTAAMVVFFFLLPLQLYLSTVAPGISEGDSAELIGTAHYLGVAHLGYPFYAVLGKAIGLIVPVGSIAYRINLLSAILMSGTIWLLAHLARKTLQIPFPFIFGILLLSIIEPMWSQATSAEVYALHLFFTILWMAIIIRKNETAPDSGQRSICAAFIVGLALAVHHYTVMWLLPYLLSRLRSPQKRIRFGLAPVSLIVVFFLLGASFFLYIPLRAIHGTPWNWNYADNWHNFMDLLTAASFRSEVMFSLGGDFLWLRLQGYLKQIMDQTGILVILFSFWGFFLLWRKNFSVTLLWLGFIGSDFLFCLFLNEAPLEVTPFGLMTKTILIVLATLAFSNLGILIENRAGRAWYGVFIFLYILYLTSAFFRSWDEIPKRNNFFTHHFSFNAATSLTAGDRLICEKDEIFPFLYSQTVEHDFHQNIILHYLCFPIPNSWYRRYLNDLYPDFRYFQQGRRLDHPTPSSPLLAIITMFKVTPRPVYVTFPDLIQFPHHVRISMQGLLYKLNFLNSATATSAREWTMYRIDDLIPPPSPLLDKYCLALNNTGRLFFNQNKIDLAEKFWLKAHLFDPGYKPVINNLAGLARYKGEAERALFYQHLLAEKQKK